MLDQVICSRTGHIYRIATVEVFDDKGVEKKKISDPDSSPLWGAFDILIRPSKE